MHPGGSPSRVTAATAVVPATVNDDAARVGEVVEEPEADTEVVLERLDDAKAMEE